MKRLIKKNLNKSRRAHRVRTKIRGTVKRPRLSVQRSLKHLSAQLIDDRAGKTLAAATDEDVKDSKKKGVDMAKAVGKVLAGRAGKKKITTVVFDRGSYAYHGKIKALAEGARAGGLKF